MKCAQNHPAFRSHGDVPEPRRALREAVAAHRATCGSPVLDSPGLCPRGSGTVLQRATPPSRCIGWAQVGLTLLAILAAASCNSRQFGEDFLGGNGANAKVVAERPLPGQWPGATGFNLHHAQRFSAGAAQAEASAEPSGKAAASCEVTAAGSAWAEFQVGQVLPASPGESRTVVARLAAAYRYELSAKGDERPAVARVTLKAVVLDSRRHVLKRQVLSEVEPGLGAEKWSGTQEPLFEFTIEPDLAYQIVLAGRVEIDATHEPAPAGAALTVESFQIDLRPRD